MIVRDAAGHVYAERKIDPFEVGILAMCLLYGALGLAWFNQLAGRTVRLYPFFGGRVFLALLLVGSLSALVGLLRSDLRGLRLERSGLWLLASLGAGYALWTPFAIGWAGLGLLLSFGMVLFVPSAVVAVRRGRLIAEIEKALRTHDRPEDDHGG